MENYSKPTPTPDPVTTKYWEGARQNKLLIQKCGDCGTYQTLPQSYCRHCLSEDLAWTQARGTGKIYSFTIVHRAPSGAFESDVPYTVALVELDEGARMMSNIVEIGPQDVRVGMPVEAIFDAISPTISLPKFRPLKTRRPS